MSRERRPGEIPKRQQSRSRSMSSCFLASRARSRPKRRPAVPRRPAADGGGQRRPGLRGLRCRATPPTPRRARCSTWRSATRSRGKTATALAEYTATARLAETQGRQDRVLIAQQKTRGDGAAHRSPDRGGPAGGSRAGDSDPGRGDCPGTDWGGPSPSIRGPHQITASAPGYRELDDELRDTGRRILVV